MQPLCPPQEMCKCCGAAAFLYGVVDFNKYCDQTSQQGLPLSGVPIYYYRCRTCRFLFTTAFDRFTRDDFQHYIYNEDYVRIDPDYVELRPRADAQCLRDMFTGRKPQRILDYGGGTGILADTLRSMGFPHADTYDPFNPRFSVKPPHLYDCVVTFQVAEHAVNPASFFSEISDFLLDPGLVVVSTLVQPPDIDRQGVNWWYVGPRNGHVALYTRESLGRVTQAFGFKICSLSDNLHLMFRELPDFARHLVSYK